MEMMNTEVTVHDAMTSNVLTINPEKSVAEAAILMTKYRIGGLIVKSNSKPEGLITKSDVIGKVVSKDLKASRITVNEIMSKNLISINPRSDLIEAARVMVRNDIKRLPVVDNGSLVGIITSTDVLRISPELTEFLVEIARRENHNEFSNENQLQGVCEVCGNFMDLNEIDGEFLCEECEEDTQGE